MRCPTLSELPSPPPGKTGWPWTKETPQLPDRMPDGRAWPQITIVTPSYNQGQFIEETIRSVLLQGYPNLQYMVIDGGSTDASAQIIQKYTPWLDYWVSEADRGQAHAINKGLERATGMVAAYLNSDDIYLPGALGHVGQTYVKRPFDLLVGQRKVTRPKYFPLRRHWWKSTLKPFVYPFIFDYTSRYELPQESIFWNIGKYRKLKFNEQYQFCLDVWWFVHLFSGALVVHTSQRIGVYREHPESKSNRLQELAKEETRLIKAEFDSYVPRITERTRQKIQLSYYNVSVRTILLRVMMPWAKFFFQYQHPPYLDISEVLPTKIDGV